MDKRKELLLAVGLNDLEADVYMLLLNEESLTGYKIGKLLHKPTANVYKAIDSLALKGALLLEDKQKGLCKAVPAHDFFATIEAGLIRKTQEAKRTFTPASKAIYDEKSYQIQSLELVLEKCRQMLQHCQKIVVIDIFPQPLAYLLPEIQACVQRGIEVYLQVYEPIVIPGAQVAFPQFYPKVLTYWKSHQLNLITDGKEYVLALFNENMTEVLQATWSRNLYLACMLHKGFSNEYTITKINEITAETNAAEQIAFILEKQSKLSSGQVPGVLELLQRFGLQE